MRRGWREWLCVGFGALVLLLILNSFLFVGWPMTVAGLALYEGTWQVYSRRRGAGISPAGRVPLGVAIADHPR
jgi:hypothetical protein